MKPGEITTVFKVNQQVYPHCMAGYSVSCALYELHLLVKYNNNES